MNQKDFERVTKAMGVIDGETRVQVMALFVATWGAIANGLDFEDPDTIRTVLSQADSQIAEGESRNMIEELRRRLVPAH